MAELYRSVQEALRASFALDAVSPCKVSTAIADLRGATVRRAADLTPLDRVAQAALVLRTVQEVLNGRTEILAVWAYYAVDGELNRGRKTHCCDTLTRVLMRDSAVVRCPTGFAYRAIRAWAGMGTVHQRTEATRYNVDPSTVQRWLHRRDVGRRAGITHYASLLVGAGEERLEPVFEDKGIC